MRERGLKYEKRRDELLSAVSLPVRERGLKFVALAVLPRWPTVAPRAGAWIEVCIKMKR